MAGAALGLQKSAGALLGGWPWRFNGHPLELFFKGMQVSTVAIVVSLKHLAAKSVSLISCFQPPLAILLAWLFLHETPALTTIIGGLLIPGFAFYAFYEALNQRPQLASYKSD
jgi:drug/metabolite transporter (DMT)-like permease